MIGSQPLEPSEFQQAIVNERIESLEVRVDLIEDLDENYRGLINRCIDVVNNLKSENKELRDRLELLEQLVKKLVGLNLQSLVKLNGVTNRVRLDSEIDTLTQLLEDLRI